ncbi:MAG TPA: cellulose binding domain-containing protein [Candidatus Limnocylindrales bacterium]|nr:cellulose binding domain-containing protein [Candidatus Limnocylindrales bacterium]
MSRSAPWVAVGTVLASVVAAITVALLPVGTPASAAAVRIMPLGDSITGSPGCWRALLWQRLTNSGITNIDFVGTLPPQGCGFPYDGENEGHGGFLATNVANQNQLPGWLSATRPDIVIMHFGTNDVWNNIAPATILAAFGTLVDQMRASNPSMKVLVAKIIPMNPSNCSDCGQRVVNFNNAIPAWASGKSTAQSPVTVVDQWTGFSTATDTTDGVHPNASGDQKISDRWFQPLAAAIGGVSPSPSVSVSPSRSPSRSPSASPSPSNPSTARCSATFKLVGQWQGGFQGEVVVTNTGTVPITGWIVTLTFQNGQVISQLWGGTYTQTGSVVTVRNMSWNGNLQPNQSANFGFLSSWNGVNNAPTLTCTPITS